MIRREDAQDGAIAEGPLLERDAEIAAIEAHLDRLESGDGGVLLVEGPAGIGKTRLMNELRTRAHRREIRVLAASGSEMEREFGFGLVRQLVGPSLATFQAEQRSDFFSGSARLAAGVFGVEEAGFITMADEAALYGLYWVVAGLAEEGPLLLAIDDAHWADAASLRFAHYLGRRIGGLGVAIVMAARPAEPGSENAVLTDLVAALDCAVIKPRALGREATAALIRGTLGSEPAAEVEEACLASSGGNPLLIREFAAAAEAAGAIDDPARLAVREIGRAQLGAGIATRAGRLDPRAPALVRAVAVLGDRARLDRVGELASVEPEQASKLVGALSAASILEVAGSEVRFVHPFLRQSVLDDISDAERCAEHGHAAALLRDRGAEPETIASHLLLAHPGALPDALEILDEAARRAARKGAAESVVAYLRRALDEPAERPRRANLLRRLGTAELSLGDPAGIEHLELAVDQTDDPAEASAIAVQIADALTLAGFWDEGVEAIERGLARLDGTGGPGALDLEAMQAAARAYDPVRHPEYQRDLPRLRALVDGHRDEESNLLRWILAAVGSLTGAPRADVLELAELDPARLTLEHRPGHESTFVLQAALAQLTVDALESSDSILAALFADARRRGSLRAAMVGHGYGAALNERRGDLQAAEASLRLLLELVQENDLSVMILTTTQAFCIDTLVERSGLDDVAELITQLELPPRFAATLSGGMLLEGQGVIHFGHGDRATACERFRAAAEILGGVGIQTRLSRWRSRLALSLPAEKREEALTLAAEELALARKATSPRSEGAALRALGLLEGGAEGIDLLKESVMASRDCPSNLETARSLAALGGALRRDGRRREAREGLRQALELARQAGAERLAEAVVEEMRTAGARLPHRELSGVGALTPAELRVAAAAAAGATNREIAQGLFVSLRTVEMHLTNTYRKLEIGSRAELARALEPGQESPPS